MPRKNKPTYTIYEVDLFGIGHGHLKLKEPAPLEYKLAIPEPNPDCCFLNEISPMEIFPPQPCLSFILRRNCMETTYKVAHIEFNNTQIDVSDITPKQWFRDHQFIPNREGWIHRGTHAPISREEQDAPEGIINHTEDHFTEVIEAQRSSTDRMTALLRNFMEHDPYSPNISDLTTLDARVICTESDFVAELHSFTNIDIADRLMTWYNTHTYQGNSSSIADTLHNNPILVSTMSDFMKYEILTASGVHLDNTPSFTIQTRDYISTDNTGAPVSITNDSNAYWETPSVGRCGYSVTGGNGGSRVYYTNPLDGAREHRI